MLLKGGHLHEGNRVIDRYFDGVSSEEFIHARLPLDAHGTGCTLASAIAAQLCNGLSLANACEAGIDYVARGLQQGYAPAAARCWCSTTSARHRTHEPHTRRPCRAVR